MDISELSQIVFPVIGYRNSEYLFLGNGFFLENPNTFITAAHILKDKAIVCEKFYYMPNGCLLPLIPVSDNLIYDPKPENSLPIFKDLAIFKTENPFNKYLHLGSIQITRNSSLVCTGFHEPLSTLETPLPIGINAIPDISRLEFEQYSLNVSHPQKADIKFKQHEHIDNDLVYTNCFDCDGGIASGISGSPILDTESGFQGMAICSNNKLSIFLQPEYICFMLIHYK